MKKQFAVGGVLLVGALGIVGCGEDASKVDLDEPKIEGDFQPEDYVVKAPDAATVFLNVDDHPTVVRLCIDGVAFRTISTSHSGLASPAVDRVPEWDDLCEE